MANLRRTKNELRAAPKVAPQRDSKKPLPVQAKSQRVQRAVAGGGTAFYMGLVGGARWQ
jgi:hypothetical protein